MSSQCLSQTVEQFDFDLEEEAAMCPDTVCLSSAGASWWYEYYSTVSVESCFGY